MPFTSSEKILIILKRNNLTENDLKQIAAALSCSIDFIFTDNETGETI